MNQRSPKRGSAQASPRKLRDRLREQTEREILEAAEKVMIQSGLLNASMADIANLAGVAVGTLYNHFADRDALLDGVILLRTEEMMAGIDARDEELAQRPFPEQLEEWLRTMYTYKEAHREFYNLLLQQDHRAHDPKRTPNPALREIVSRIERLLERGRRARAIGPDPDGRQPYFLLGLARAGTLRHLLTKKPIDLSEEVRSVAAFFLHGARPGK